MVHPDDGAVKQLDAVGFGHVCRRIKIRAAAIPPVVVALDAQQEVAPVPALSEEAVVVGVRKPADAEVERGGDVGDVPRAHRLPARGGEGRDFARVGEAGGLHQEEAVLEPRRLERGGERHVRRDRFRGDRAQVLEVRPRVLVRAAVRLAVREEEVAAGRAVAERERGGGGRLLRQLDDGREAEGRRHVRHATEARGVPLRAGLERRRRLARLERVVHLVVEARHVVRVERGDVVALHLVRLVPRAVRDLHAVEVERTEVCVVVAGKE